MTGDNVQTWDDVAELPWREAFDLFCPATRVTPPAPQRRRTDTRSLADVVAEMAVAA